MPGRVRSRGVTASRKILRRIIGHFRPENATEKATGNAASKISQEGQNMGTQLKQVHTYLTEIDGDVVQKFAGPQMTHGLVRRYLAEIGGSESDIHTFVRATQGRIESSLLKSAHSQIGSAGAIPKLSHRIWITSKTDPAFPPTSYMDQIFHAAKQPQDSLTHILWTNSSTVAEKIREEIRQNESAILVAEISLFGRDDLYKTVEAFVGEKKYVLAADIAKFMILDRFGGIYTDLGIRYEPPVIELLGFADYCLLLADNLIFQTCFVACAPGSDLCAVFLAAMNNPESLAPYFIGRDNEISPLDEVAVFAGPAFTVIAMLFLPEPARTVIFPQESKYISWSSQQSWYADVPKFGNIRVIDSVVTVLDPKKLYVYQQKADQHLAFFGDMGTLKQKLTFLVKTFNYYLEHPTRLCKILKFNGSDKALAWHNYSSIYNFIFSRFVGAQPQVFEVGMGTNYLDVPSSMGVTGVPGASLRAWREFFVNAEVFGGDVDRRILFQEEHIKTFFVDQTNRETIKQLWDKVGNVEFDLIIDDGLHEFGANINFLEGSIHMLKPDGMFVIEDVICTLLPQWEAYLSNSGLSAAIVRLPHGVNHQDNCFIIVLKSSFGGDSSRL